MQGTISFHPIRVDVFERLIEPLVGGDKANPEHYLDAALNVRHATWHAHAISAALERVLEELKPPPLPSAGTPWEKIRARLERFDHKVRPLARLASRLVEPALHLRGRPFFITEGSVQRVADVVDDYLAARDAPSIESLAREQLIRLDRELGKQVVSEEAPPLSPDMSYRAELLRSLQELHDLARAARSGTSWGPALDVRKPAIEVLVRELPYRALWFHSRVVPFWIAEDVDGLETVCRSAGILPPPCLVSARSLFPRACTEFPALGEALHVELDSARDIGAFVAPRQVPELMDFLTLQGGRIIQVATRHGAGDVCQSVLRKIKECAAYAARHEMGYLEASGIGLLCAPADESA